jgi:hypothetical protein
MFMVLLQVIIVIEGNLFTSLDVSKGDDPDAAVNVLRLGVRGATVIYQTGRVPIHIAIEIVLVIQAKDAGIFQLALAERFLFVNFYADIFDNVGFRRNISPRISARAMNGGISELDQLVVLHAADSTPEFRTKFKRRPNFCSILFCTGKISRLGGLHCACAGKNGVHNRTPYKL